MTVTRDVVKDLLTVYLAGEASTDTRVLVEEYLVGDPALAREVEAARAADFQLAAPLAADPTSEKIALDRTRQLLKHRTSTLVVAVLFTVLPLSFTFDATGVRFLLIRDAPTVGLAWWATAAAMWACHLWIRSRLSVSGLLSRTRRSSRVVRRPGRRCFQACAWPAMLARTPMRFRRRALRLCWLARAGSELEQACHRLTGHALAGPGTSCARRVLPALPRGGVRGPADAGGRGGASATDDLQGGPRDCGDQNRRRARRGGLEDRRRVPVANEWAPGDNIAPPVRPSAWSPTTQRNLYVAFRALDPRARATSART